MLAFLYDYLLSRFLQIEVLVVTKVGLVTYVRHTQTKLTTEYDFDIPIFSVV